VVGEEGRMNESIIVGLVIGGGVAIGHFLRLREMDQQWDREKQRMEALWAEEERRRKSDRRRELYERELKIVTDSLYTIMEGIIGSVGEEEFGSLLELISEAHTMMWKAGLVLRSLGDEELMEGCQQLYRSFLAWRDLLDFETGEPKQGREEEFDGLAGEARQKAAEVQRRIRQILEEV